jgi:hypothetical protein
MHHLNGLNFYFKFLSLAWLEDSFGNVPDLSSKLQDVREENMRHSQYVTAMENLKHIFTVPESVERTKQWITENKLLHAHQVHISYTKLLYLDAGNTLH